MQLYRFSYIQVEMLQVKAVTQFICRRESDHEKGCGRAKVNRILYVAIIHFVNLTLQKNRVKRTSDGGTNIIDLLMSHLSNIHYY